MKNNEAGFSYVDTMVGLTIMLIGLLGLAGTIGASVMRSRQQEQQLLAKQYATSSMESIISARDINADGLTDGWDSIGNVGSNYVSGSYRGVFLTGWQPLKPEPGADDLVGTSDDSGTPVAGMARQIVITDTCDPERPSPGCLPSGTNPIAIRQITVTIRYQNNASSTLTESVSTTLTKY